MDKLHIIITGENAGAAADQLAPLLDEGEAAGTVTRLAPSELPETTRKVIDPLSLAAVILAIPPTVLAVADLTERIRKRRKAEAVIEQASRLTVDLKVQVLIVASNNQTHTVSQVTPDQILEIGQPR